MPVSITGLEKSLQSMEILLNDLHSRAKPSSHTDNTVHLYRKQRVLFNTEKQLTTTKWPPKRRDLQDRVVEEDEEKGRERSQQSL